MGPTLSRLFLTVSVVATAMALHQSAGFAQGIQPPKQSLLQGGTSAGMTSAQGFGPAAAAYGAAGATSAMGGTSAGMTSAQGPAAAAYAAMGTPGSSLTGQAGLGAQQLIGTGFTYRHDWGDRNGQWTLNLNWGAVTRDSRVFVAIAECAPGGGKFIGGARYTLHNVAPGDGVVSLDQRGVGLAHKSLC